jgi:hypothetical protein
MVNEDLKRASQFNEPRDEVAVALAGLAHGVELVEPDFLEAESPLHGPVEAAGGRLASPASQLEGTAAARPRV